ncbi:glycosyltransferase family 4 protein [Caulobacter mirabilis]|uniref:Glycosyltransferase WbuB n=1 Tax=Caulobacter mirabilis TaxID=69666 RepID=A0A2D2AT04_9CAUL|nr:glycosyltransferase family 4 protein [Caulobacter mirabilis]ATQ41142.1 hypothetical protein CSW64_01310 [Caulobacter mirabilis]
MRIWTTVMGQRLDDAANTRSMLLCSELLSRGHEVVMWTSAWDHIRKEWRKEWVESGGKPVRRSDGLEIRFMKGCGYQQNTSPRRLVDHWMAAADFAKQARSAPRPDAIVASSPDHVTAAAAVKFGRSIGAVTLIDIRDKWPDILFDLTRGSLVKRAAGGVAMVFEQRRTRQALRRADGIVAMMNSMMDWGLAKADRPRTDDEKVFFLTTAPKNFDVPAKPLESDHAISRALEAARGKTVFAFAGTFNRTQHPALLLDAVDRLKQQGRLREDRVAFLIGGAGQDADVVERRAAAHACVHYVGWMKPHEMDALLRGSDVGLLLMNFPSEAFNNKTFSYMASGLPIISGATGDLHELINEYGVGVNVTGGNVDQLADAIDLLASDDQERARMTTQMRALFDSRFDQKGNYAAYADHIEAMVAKKSARAV